MSATPANITLLLYSTSACHLCEEAEAIVTPLLLNNAQNASLQIVDISEDEELMQRYAVKIPVLKRDDGNAELNWPFDTEDVTSFLG